MKKEQKFKKCIKNQDDSYLAIISLNIFSNASI